ncbi:MAG: protein kinase [Phycisphaerales bacterium JB059]
MGSGRGSRAGARGDGDPGAGEAAGARIGPYRLLEQIGEGGFGVVYAAEQVEPVRRRVALKVIKAGMDSEQVVARFEAERQALAVMDHPCIAKVFDGGVTPPEMGARPYFVMELVKGEPITDFCDQNRLSVRERCELMIRVCNAVQHAHTKGVVHRDLKPSNILVSYDADGGATPKVIDFGIAKALNQRLSEKTIFTERGKIIGTPEYMSPEQAEMSGLDIDTRSDVYSLGVLLYALLTGSLPFTSEKLRDAAYAELVRIIKEEEPEKPSTRVLSLMGSAADVSEGSRVAKARHTDARSLTSTLRRDLDWVVMTCLEKDRARRYETASALGEELRRYLDDEPVVAGPPSVTYRVEKFVSRHRAGVVVALAGVLVLFVSSVLFSALAYYAFDQKFQAEEAKEAAWLSAQSEKKAKEDALLAAQSEREAAENTREVLLYFRGAFESVNPPWRGWPGGARAVGPSSETLLTDVFDEGAASDSSAFIARPRLRAEIDVFVGTALYVLGRVGAGRERLRGAINELDAHGIESPLRAEASLALAESLVVSPRSGVGEWGEAVELLDVVIAEYTRDRGQNDPETVRAELLHVFASALKATATRDGEKMQESFDRAEVIRDRAERVLGKDHPLAMLGEVREFAVAAAMPFAPDPSGRIESYIERARRSLGPDSYLEYVALTQLVMAQTTRRKTQEEIEASDRLVGVVLRLLGANHEESLRYLQGHVAMLAHHKRHEHLERFLREYPEALSALESSGASGGAVRSGWLRSLMARGCDARGDRAQLEVECRLAMDAWREADPEHQLSRNPRMLCSVLWVLKTLKGLGLEADYSTDAEFWKRIAADVGVDCDES